MDPNRHQIQILDWDSQFFGFRIARVTVADGELFDAKNIVSALKSAQVRAAYFLAPENDQTEAAQYLDHGFKAVDIREEWHWSGECPPYPSQLSSIKCSPKLEELARTSFTTSRFFADPHFPQAKAGELFVHWLRKSTRIEGIQDRAFISWDRTATGAQISLIAVEQDGQKSGLGKLLVQAVQAQSPKVQVVTQNRNIAARKLYARAGFQLQSSRTWFHWWSP